MLITNLLKESESGDISDELKAAIYDARPDIVRLAVAMLYSSNESEAYRWVGIPIGSIGVFKSEVDKLLNLIKVNYIDSAWIYLKHHAMEAVAVKVEGLRSDNERIRQKAATEILDRVLGKPRVHDQGNSGDLFKVIHVKSGLDPAVWDENLIDVTPEDNGDG